MGTVSWYFLWLPYERSADSSLETVRSAAVTDVTAAAPEPEAAKNGVAEPEQPEPPPGPPAGSVLIKGGEVVLAGGDNRPLERVMLDDFAIAETEVTNAEYSEFVRETGHASPAGWNGHVFPAGTENFPVVNVSWRDAAAFCEWKSRKLGLPVRLPTEAEWEHAARGPDKLKYPWGSDWNPEAAASKETGGKVAAVKSFAANRTPSGVYDMVGNVWEWVSDEVGETEAVTDADAEAARQQGRTLRIVKGGSAEESSGDLNSQARYEVPERTAVNVIGFRYVILPAKRN